MVTTIEIGKAFEEKAKNALESEGYEIVRWLSKECWASPCDFIVKRDGVEKYCEVRGTTKEQNAFVFSGKKMAALEELAKEKPMIFVLIRINAWRIVSLEDMPMERYVAYPRRKLASNYYRKFLHGQKGKKEKGDIVHIRVVLNHSVYLSFKKLFEELDAGTNVEALTRLMAFYTENKRRYNADFCYSFFDTRNNKKFTQISIELDKKDYFLFKSIGCEFGVRLNEEVFRRLLDFYLFAQGNYLTIIPRHEVPRSHQISVELYKTTYDLFRRVKADMGAKTNFECMEKLLDFWDRNHERGKGKG